MKGPLTIAVGGGKGGVGKSVVSANLAVAVSRLGFRVVLFDADLGAANLHTMFGIDRPRSTLQALLEKKIGTLEEAVMPTCVPRLFLVPGSGATPGAANVAHAQKQKLIRHLHALTADVVIIDCGAGVSFNTLDFFTLADHRLLVATPQLTSLQNAYAFLKGAVYRSMRQTAMHENEEERFAKATTGSETERVRDVLERIRAADSDFADALERCVSNFNASIVGNQLEHQKQHHVLHALSRMMSDFLSTRVPVHGAIPMSSRVHASVTQRRPFLVDAIDVPEARVLLQIAEKFVGTDVAALRAARRRDVPKSFPPDATDWEHTQDKDAHLPGPLANYVRRYDRLTADWPTVLKIGGMDQRGQIVDVSLGGVAVATDAKVVAGDVLTLIVEHPTERVHVESVVRHVDAERNRLGLEFTNDDSKMVAAKWVAELEIKYGIKRTGRSAPDLMAVSSEQSSPGMQAVQGGSSPSVPSVTGKSSQENPAVVGPSTPNSTVSRD